MRINFVVVIFVVFVVMCAFGCGVCFGVDVLVAFFVLHASCCLSRIFLYSVLLRAASVAQVSVSPFCILRIVAMSTSPFCNTLSPRASTASTSGLRPSGG